MQEQKRFSSLLDYAGIASLGTAIISLIAISAFSQILPEPILFKIFYGAMSPNRRFRCRQVMAKSRTARSLALRNATNPATTTKPFAS